MATDVLGRDRAVADLKLKAPRTQRPNATEFAERAWTQVLESCADTMDLDGPKAVADQMRQGDPVVRLLCCHGLAEQIASFLRSSQQSIKAVYAPDCDKCPQGFCSDGGIVNTPSVHLLVWARKRTPALSSQAATLGNALAHVCQSVVGTQELPTLLHVQVMDDADLEKLFGAGQRARWPIRLESYLLFGQGPGFVKQT